MRTCRPWIEAKIALTALFLLLAGCGGGAPAGSGGPGPGAEAEPAPVQEVYRWKLITTWPKNLPGLGMAAENFAARLRTMSAGRLDIQVYGAGELVGAFEVFDAVSQGTAEMGHGAAYYWRGKLPVAALFSTVPFGMTAQEMNGWLYHGGGLELWRELYEPFSLVPLAAGNSGTQMAGWFNKEIRSLDDLQGLKMRIPGLGGEVLRRVGGVPVTVPGGEVFTALQTGVIDAMEWVGPYNDLALGLHTAARYYYYPGWHEPGPTLEAIVNKSAFDALPEDLRAMIEVTAQAINADALADFTAHNGRALQTLLQEHGVQLRRLPPGVLDSLRETSRQVVAEIAEENELARRIHDSYLAFYEEVKRYHQIAEQAYLEVR